ncbi:MAG: Gfo/Idh/MocA family oxidoreductase [Phycisphaeraceae bacterium]|nr:Gfo/Idh/MocA family oxidoreductase [Phycisphaerae bacterium]MBX3392152.1 Gfo/Idh/MocA family oxidoreductase [Phycisphaeraceae bacterium]HRJ49330.1 Gfo/Idh/MocA family oxidoreductase [Phycisphaerales bacterium]
MTTAIPESGTPGSGLTVAGRPVVVESDRFAGRTIRCGVVGVGRMGQHHARVYSNLPGCSLVGVVDANDDRRGAIAGKFETVPMATVAQMIEAGVDCVSIAVPTIHHYAAAEPLLRAGVACLIEKPLAGDVQTARQLKELSESTGSVLMVGHIERFNPVMRAMQKAMLAGDPIIPRFLEIHRVSPMTFRSVDVGVVLDMMIHDLDVVLMLMDGQEPDDVQASGVAVITEHEDICNARLTWKNARIAGGRTVVANITASRLALKTERIARITGENCYVKIDYGAKSGTLIRRIANEIQMREVRDQIRSGADLTHLKWHELVNIEPLAVDDAEPIVAEITAFLDAVKTGARPPIDAEAGFANVRTAERIVQAIRQTL